MSEQFNENIERDFTDEQQEKTKKVREKKPMTTGKKWVTVVAMALVFGLIAGGTMFGVNAAGNYLAGNDSSSDEVGQTQTTASDSNFSSDGSGQGTVAEVAKNAMPSVVTISTMSVE